MFLNSNKCRHILNLLKLNTLVTLLIVLRIWLHFYLNLAKRALADSIYTLCYKSIDFNLLAPASVHKSKCQWKKAGHSILSYIFHQQPPAAIMNDQHQQILSQLCSMKILLPTLAKKKVICDRMLDIFYLFCQRI